MIKPFFLLAAIILSVAAHAAEVRFEEDYALPIVYLNIVADVGASQDPADKLGLANIGAHMLLRGTQKHDKLAFFEHVNQLGGRIDVDPRPEGTVIRAGVLAENLEKFLELLGEALTRPKFTSGELSKLKREIISEILEQKGNDKSLVQLHFYRFLYDTHPYGNPLMGTQKGVAAITSKDVLDYYARNYSGKTLRVFGTGAAKKDVIEKWFNDVCDKLSAVHPEARPMTAVPAPEIPKGRRALIVNKPNATQSQILLGGAGMRPESPGFYAVQLANHVFGGPSFQARLMVELRVKRGWTYGASSSFKFGRQPRHFAMYVFPKTDDTPAAVALELSLFENFVKNGISSDEFRFARDSLVNSAPFNYDTPKKRLENATTEYLMGFPDGYFKNFAANIEGVSQGDINEALAKTFDPANLSLTIVGDAAKLRTSIAKLPGFGATAIKSYLED